MTDQYEPEEISQEEQEEEVIDVEGEQPEKVDIPDELDMGTEDDITSDDKLWSAIGYPIPFIALIALLMEDKRERPFIKYHAVQSIAFNIVIWVLILIASAITLGIGAICAPLIWLVTLWPAYDSYRGNYTEIPVITNFIKNQGWV